MNRRPVHFHRLFRRPFRYPAAIGADPEAGRVSLFLAVAMIGVLTVIGLAFDGAGQLRSMHRADNLAAEAARTGGQAIDLRKAINGEPKVLDRNAARAAVQSYLNTISNVTLRQITFSPDNREITVVVDVRYDTLFLDLLGFPDETMLRGQATARLLTGP
jgi:hypothetical protein